MKAEKKRRVWAWIGALAAGCGLCCVPLILPLLAGTALAGGLSSAVLEGVPLDLILCGGVLVGAGGGAFWLLSRKRVSQNDACQTDMSPSQSSVSIKPLEKPNN